GRCVENAERGERHLPAPWADGEAAGDPRPELGRHTCNRIARRTRWAYDRRRATIATDGGRGHDAIHRTPRQAGGSRRRPLAGLGALVDKLRGGLGKERLGAVNVERGS